MNLSRSLRVNARSTHLFFPCRRATAAGDVVNIFLIRPSASHLPLTRVAAFYDPVCHVKSGQEHTQTHTRTQTHTATYSRMPFVHMQSGGACGT